METVQTLRLLAYVGVVLYAVWWVHRHGGLGRFVRLVLKNIAADRAETVAAHRVDQAAQRRSRIQYTAKVAAALTPVFAIFAAVLVLATGELASAAFPAVLALVVVASVFYNTDGRVQAPPGVLESKETQAERLTKKVESRGIAEEGDAKRRALEKLHSDLAHFFECCRCSSRGERAADATRVLTNGPLWRYLGGPLTGAVTIQDRIMFCKKCDHAYCRVCSGFAQKGNTTGHFCPSCEGEFAYSPPRDRVKQLLDEIKELERN